MVLLQIGWTDSDKPGGAKVTAITKELQCGCVLVVTWVVSLLPHHPESEFPETTLCCLYGAESKFFNRTEAFLEEHDSSGVCIRKISSFACASE
jgi:hypothetical protein